MSQIAIGETHSLVHPYQFTNGSDSYWRDTTALYTPISLLMGQIAIGGTPQPVSLLMSRKGIGGTHCLLHP